MMERIDILIQGVLDLCCDYLRDNLAPENCIGVIRFARQHFCKKLENDGLPFYRRTFCRCQLK
ncbi:PREDICTED: kelch-like protein diablo [Wasmannia auropunctata]|uniref:kelch-like protein diablo n=1 Tax=Wasmannia auropunctata TaxID=64793 RepID=UPI0005F012D0|nr:PREDICTED: kelch-like protein diablo [Wasmannia auropunctata]